jgi:hypothetical protein
MKWGLHGATLQQAHTVCVGQNELATSHLEDFGQKVTLKWRSMTYTVNEFSYMCCNDQSWEMWG